MNEMSATEPTEVEQLQKQVKALTKELEEKSPEAIYSITIDPNGRLMLTVRSRPGESGDSYLIRFDTMLKKLGERGFNVKPSSGNAAPLTAPGEPSPAPVTGNAKGGTAHAVLMKVGLSYSGNKPQLQFECDGMEHPLSYTRPVADMIKLLALVGQYTPDQLTNGKKYAVNYRVDWELGEPTSDGKRYRNIVAVRPNA
jgi:hypothetical protein